MSGAHSYIFLAYILQVFCYLNYKILRFTINNKLLFNSNYIKQHYTY